MNANVIKAVFKRNLAGYFSSPIGYVFICAFVLLSGFAAFWPYEFFNSNLATLDQLNARLPWIMLVFIPAITMSLWAEERRQGTDELLLTLPCRDHDVVLGKYLAAVAIYTIALIFSLSNIAVLRGLGQPDIGLLLGNYVGYWLVGSAMLSIGMVASFLTSSLTVGFVLGLILNAPLVFASEISSLRSEKAGKMNELLVQVADFLHAASIGEQFRDFGRGLITLSGIAFFMALVVLSLYLSMILIGRRHWGGRNHNAGAHMALHFALRTMSLIAIIVGVMTLVHRVDWRFDVSRERINSLSSQTKSILKSLETADDRPVYVEAFISPHVPEEYVQTRLNLITMLREADALAGDKVVVRFHETERFSQEEALAEQQFGIQARPVQSSGGGKMAIDQIILGAAFSCGLDKVVVPFFDRGTPAEYEVIRSIATVSQQQRKKIGVLTTDARLFGGFDMDTFSQRPTQQLIEELQKQYDIVQVNPEQPITEKFDALLAVQPSSLPPAGLENFVAAVRAGQPTAIFEDPFPFLDATIPATSQPRQNPRRNPFMQQQQQPEPKGDVNQLWSALGVQISGNEIIWQDYNPYPKIAEFNKVKEFVFVGKGSGASEPFNQSNPITSGLQQIVSLFAGSIEPSIGTTSKIVPLLQTSTQSGMVAFDEILQRNFFGQGNLNPNRRWRVTHQSHVMAAYITGPGQIPQNNELSPSNPAPAGSLNVVLVSDVDLLSSEFFAIRARGGDQNDPVLFNLDNVTFVLNTLDFLAGDERFVDLRKRRPAHRTLTTIEAQTELAKLSANDERDRFVQQFDAKRQEEQQKLDAKLAELKNRQGVDQMQAMNEIAMAQQAGQNRLNVAIEQMEKDRDQELEKIERRLALQVRQVQDKYKWAAVVFPAIPPLLFGAFVFQRRRSMEKIGVPKARMKN